MDPVIRDLWIQALLSGHYQQAVGRLRVNDCYCVFGVLTDLYFKAARGNGEWKLECIQPLGHGREDLLYVGSISGPGKHHVAVGPSPIVLNWAKIPYSHVRNLTSLNDLRAPFRRLAELIRVTL